jgi:hypothetical protein
MTTSSAKSKHKKCPILNGHQLRMVTLCRAVSRLVVEAVEEDEHEAEDVDGDVDEDELARWTEQQDAELSDQTESDDYPSDSETTKELREKKHLRTRGCFMKKRRR